MDLFGLTCPTYTKSCLFKNMFMICLQLGGEVQFFFFQILLHTIITTVCVGAFCYTHILLIGTQCDRQEIRLL